MFCHSTASRQVVAPTQPPIQRAPRRFLPGVKVPRPEFDHAPQSSTEGKTGRAVPLPGVLLNQLSAGTTLSSFYINIISRSNGS
jgi:hypothetical protein